MIKTGENRAERQTLEKLGALSTSNNLHVLRQLMLQNKPQRTLEIGLSYGGSCLLIAATHREKSGQALRQHMALDPFQKEVWDDSGLLAVERAGYPITWISAQFSSLMLPRLVENGESSTWSMLMAPTFSRTFY